jgi:hypothetical protein
VRPAVCFIVLAFLSTSIWTVLVAILASVTLALWRWYSWSRTAHERT